MGHRAQAKWAVNVKPDKVKNKNEEQTWAIILRLLLKVCTRTYWKSYPLAISQCRAVTVVSAVRDLNGPGENWAKLENLGMRKLVQDLTILVPLSGVLGLWVFVMIGGERFIYR